jgi:hypothetical protein
MANNISSIPGANLFRSVLTLLIILICIVSFFIYTEHLTEKANMISKQRVLIDIKYTLAMTLYDYAVQRRLADFPLLDNSNPFELMKNYRSIPENYWGEVFKVDEPDRDGWYFESSSNRVVYYSKKKGKELYVIDYIKEGDNKAGGLQIIEIIPEAS